MKSVTTIAIALCLSFSSHAANYVVIGAFANKNNAAKLADRTPNAIVEINAAIQLYYVFVLKTEDHQVALTEARRLQKETEHIHAWVFSGTLGEGGGGKDIVVSIKEEIIAEKDPTPVVNTSVNTKDFYFNVIRDDGMKADGAEITVINPANQRKEYVFKGNENVTMKALINSDDIRFECELVGFRKLVQTVNFKNPNLEDGVTVDNNRITVPFQLVRLKKGDISVLYNVFFYKDAAIMRPESKYDLDGLLAMMNENPNYKIKIHGHTNGSAAGKIMEVGETGEFFSLTGAKEGSGSAKKLSGKRAEVIRDYLVKAGVDPTRMAIKAWGGKKPIYDKHATQASANVRVEVEVIEE